MSEAKRSPFAIEQIIDPVKLKEDVEFTFANLDDAVRKQASLYIHYAMLAGKARRQHDTLKATFEILESRLDAEHRKVLTEASEKKPTEAAIAAAVKGDSRWFSAQQRLAEAREIMDLCNDAKEALSQRRDMLIQVTADRRIEAQGEMRIKVAQSSTDAARDRAMAVIQGRAA